MEYYCSWEVGSSMMESRFEYIYSMDLYELFKNFRYLGEGSSRVVFGIDNQYVVKCSKSRNGDKQCSKENRIYSKANDHYKDYLCPIVWYKKGMIVMPRAVSLRHLIGRKAIETSRIRPGKDVHEDLRKLSKKYGLYFTDLLSSSSWGFVNNRLVLIDYGCTGLGS